MCIGWLARANRKGEVKNAARRGGNQGKEVPGTSWSRRLPRHWLREGKITERVPWRDRWRFEIAKCRKEAARS